MIQRFRNRPHPHIVRYLAAWAQQSNFYILFELASTNLQSFIHPSFNNTSQSSKPLSRNIPRLPGSNRPEMDLPFQDWILHQVAGLADALAYVHNITADTFGSAPREVSRSNLQIDEIPSQQRRAVGFHHDIKLDNILVCDIGGRDFGTLKLGDFGSARVKTLRLSQFSAASRTPQQTEEEDGAITYQSPDLELKGHASRNTDIWALGCVFLELMLWCFDDSFTVSDFSNKRVEEEQGPSSSNRFWKRKTGRSRPSASLKACVVDRLDFLQEHATHERPFRVWFETVQKMLEVDDRRRPGSGSVRDQLLDNYSQHTEEDEE